ncbi:hypothetical protein ACA910_022613 [Epithemia clementina (nom. ined.)]
MLPQKSVSSFLLLVVVLPLSLVDGHGCTSFRLADDDLRTRFQINEQVPDPIKNFVTSLGTSEEPFGVYDCHNATGDYEVGYTAACVANGTCMCTALYNFMECQSCSVSCGADINSLDTGSFQADCRNVKTDISSTCTVECGYDTYNCFIGDPSKSVTSATSDALRGMPTSLLWASALFAVVRSILSFVCP